MRHRRTLRTLFAASSAVAVVAVLGSCAPTPMAGAGRPTATAAPAAAGARELAVADTPAWVGALFAPDADQSSCTGTVLEAGEGDLVLTAAHCVLGTGEGMRFVPGLAGDEAAGTWAVTAAYVDDAWVDSASPLDDFAILRVAPTAAPSDGAGEPTGPDDAPLATSEPGSVESEAADMETALPAGLPLGEDPAPGTSVTVVAYPGGEDRAISCTAPSGRSRTEVGWVATFPCEGYVGGTSGGAWVSEESGSPMIVGLIGGYHLGGCRSLVSYTSPASRLAPLLAQVEAGAEPSDVPAATDDGCGP